MQCLLESTDISRRGLQDTYEEVLMIVIIEICQFTEEEVETAHVQ